MDEKHRKTWIKNTQTSIVRKNTWRKNTQTSMVEKIYGKKPTVREKMKIYKSNGSV